MSCIVLFGGIIGCGKTELINFFLRNKKTLFENKKFQIANSYTVSDISRNGERMGGNINFCVVSFDELCPIEEQVNLMKTFKGMKNFRADLLEAAKCYISLVCNSSCESTCEISLRSKAILKKLKLQNNNTPDDGNTCFLVEDNFYYRSMRYEWFQLARRVNIGFCQVFVTCPLDTAIERNRSRNYHIPEDRIKIVYSCLEYPDQTKHKWEKHSILFDSTRKLECSILKEITDLIEIAQSNPAEIMLNEKKKEAQIICSKNVIHQADRIIRKLTSRKISSMKNISNRNDLRDMVPAILGARQKLLTDLKQKSIGLPSHLCESIENLGIDSVEKEFETILTELFESAFKLSKNKELNL